MLSTGDGDDTMVSVWNPADETQDFVFTLFFTGGHYNFPVHLEGRATRTFNISEIIENQVPDDEGNVIPASIHQGSAEIRGSKGENQHILLSVDAGTYNVRKATCGTFCITCNGTVIWQVTPPPVTTLPGKVQTSFTVTYNTGTKYDLTSSATWSSSNNSVATVSAGLVTAVSAGSFEANASDPLTPNYFSACYGSNQDLRCPMSQGVNGSAPGTVGPDHLSVVADNEGYVNNCPQGKSPVYLRQMQMQVMDANNNAITTSTSIQETQSPSSPQNSCPGLGSPQPTGCAGTDSGGTFIDSMAAGATPGNPQSLCYPTGTIPAGCGFTVTSTWSACSTSGSKNLWVSPRTTHSDSITVDGKASPNAWAKGTQCTTSGCQ